MELSGIGWNGEFNKSKAIRRKGASCLRVLFAHIEFIDQPTFGDLFPDGVSNLKQVIIRAGDTIDSIQLVYSNQTRPAHGGSGGKLYTFNLAPDEHITGVAGKYGTTIDSLILRTDKGQQAKWGGNGGDVVFDYAMPKGAWIAGFRGRSGDSLDAIGPVIVWKD
jgi:hypothetical protein